MNGNGVHRNFAFCIAGCKGFCMIILGVSQFSERLSVAFVTGELPPLFDSPNCARWVLEGARPLAPQGSLKGLSPRGDVHLMCGSSAEAIIWVLGITYRDGPHAVADQLFLVGS